MIADVAPEDNELVTLKEIRELARLRVAHEARLRFTILPSCLQHRRGEHRSCETAENLRDGDFDILIAATAMNEDATLVTDNARHFQRVDGLRIENYR